MNRPFQILSIDGGGIRGIFPAKFLADIEAKLQQRPDGKSRIYEHFDLICGTSTGGIIAIALALGIPAGDIYQLYKNNAKKIFAKKGGFLRQIRQPQYERAGLEQLIREQFKIGDSDEDARLGDCKTAVCVPVYDLMQGKPAVMKSRYRQDFFRDYHIPAYQVALATAAAPTYFNPYSGQYRRADGTEEKLTNKVDGGVFANNPALLAIVEAQKAFDVPLEKLRMLSIGTGYQKFSDAAQLDHCGIWYWMLPIPKPKKRLIELFMQGQSQQVENLISLMHKGIGGSEAENFIYERINTELDASCRIDMDATDDSKLALLSEKAHLAFQQNAARILQRFF